MSMCHVTYMSHTFIYKPWISPTGRIWHEIIKAAIHLCSSPRFNFSFFLNFALGQWFPCQFPLLLPGSSFTPSLSCFTLAHVSFSPSSLLFVFSRSSLPVCRSSGVKYNRLWYAALAFVTLMLFTVAVGVLVFMSVYYTDPEACLYNKIFLGLNGSLCLLVSLLAISPSIQKRKRVHVAGVCRCVSV